MARPTIFLSHISEERELAALFRTKIEESFLGMVDVFQSTDPRSLPLGQNWLNNITDALTRCEAILLFCSPQSVQRPWINFECGAGWARRIEVAPLCHSGLRPVDLPVPISLLQGIQASDAFSLNQVFAMIAGKLGSLAPSFDASQLSTNVKAFEREYVEEVTILTQLRIIKKASAELFEVLGMVPVNKVTPVNNFPERYMERCRQALEALQETGAFAFSYEGLGVSFGGPHAGPMGTLTLNISPTVAKGVAKITAQ
jgi:hypothetical protein